MDEHKGVDDIEKKVGIFHVLNGILAKTRNLIFKKKKKKVSRSYCGFLGGGETIGPFKKDFFVQHSSCEPRLSREKRERLNRPLFFNFFIYLLTILFVSVFSLVSVVSFRSFR